MKNSSVKGTVECEICQYAMGYLDGMLKQNSTKQEIQQALDTLCGYLPSQYKQEVWVYTTINFQLLLMWLAFCDNLCNKIRQSNRKLGGGSSSVSQHTSLESEGCWFKFQWVCSWFLGPNLLSKHLITLMAKVNKTFTNCKWVLQFLASTSW